LGCCRQLTVGPSACGRWCVLAAASGCPAWWDSNGFCGPPSVMVVYCGPRSVMTACVLYLHGARDATGVWAYCRMGQQANGGSTTVALHPDVGSCHSCCYHAHTGGHTMRSSPSPHQEVTARSPFFEPALWSLPAHLPPEEWDPMELEACIPSPKPTLAQPSMEDPVLESVCFLEASLTTLSPAQAHS
jgi:hypothetical protein